MATFQDVWNEIDRRVDDKLDERLGAANSSTSAGSPPPSAGGLPIHNNMHHEPALALESDLAAHVIAIASADDLGHIRIGDGLEIDVDGILSVTTAGLLSFLELTDTPDSYVGQASKVVRVKADVTGLEFYTLTASDVGALTQAAADLLYDPIGEAAAEMAAHLLAANPHPQYLTQAEGDALYSPLGHVQAVDEGGTGLTGIAADRIIYTSAADTFSAAPITAFGLSLIDDADAAAARTTLELIAGGDGDIWVLRAGDTMTGNLTISRALSATLSVVSTGAAATLTCTSETSNANFNFNAAGQAQLNWQKWTGGAASARFLALMTSTAESGGNAGSNWQLLRRTDAGASLGQPVLAIERATGFIGVHRAEATATYTLDILGTFRVDATTGGIATLYRTSNISGANQMIGRLTFDNSDSDLSTQNSYGYIEVQSAAAISGDAARGRMLFAVTPNTVASAPVVRLTIEEDGRIHGSALHNNAGAVTGTTNQYMASGTYTPTLNNTTNVAASTPYQCQWIRVGNVVTVSGKVDVDPTAAAATVLGISLPIASNFGAVEDCAGAAFSPAVAGQGAAILGSVANDRAEMQWVAVDTANRAMSFTFTYEVI